jgi:hypothetical protein
MRDHDFCSRPNTDECVSEIGRILATGVCRMQSRATILVDTPDDKTFRDSPPNCPGVPDATRLTVHNR